MASTQTTTKRGTLISKKWDGDWIDAVESTEKELGRRCCGAHAPDDTPCQLQSTHANGRCRFHGGARGIGAPKGNLNARIHGLYSRRLQVCGDLCPQWKTCPMAGQDILKLAEKHRPICAYEQEEHEILEALEQRSKPKEIKRYDTAPEGDSHPFWPEITTLRHNLHTLQIMITRAVSVLRLGLTQSNIVESESYRMESSKPSAALQAYQILSREHRHTTLLYERLIEKYGRLRDLKIIPFPKERLL